MKRLSILSVILLFLFACEGDTGPMGPPGEPGKNGDWLILELTLLPDKWKLEGDGEDALNSRWVASYPLKDITKHILDEGAILFTIIRKAGEG